MKKFQRNIIAEAAGRSRTASASGSTSTNPPTTSTTGTHASSKHKTASGVHPATSSLKKAAVVVPVAGSSHARPEATPANEKTRGKASATSHQNPGTVANLPNEKKQANGATAGAPSSGGTSDGRKSTASSSNLSQSQVPPKSATAVTGEKTPKASCVKKADGSPENSNTSDRRTAPAQLPRKVEGQVTGDRDESSYNVGNLRVLMDPPGMTLTEFDDEPRRETMKPATENSNEFIIMSHCVHTGLRIWENPKGTQSLVKGGLSLVETRSRKRQPLACKKEITDAEMFKTVKEFLRKIRKDFPNIYLTRTLDADVPAETERVNWGSSLDDKYEPKLAAIMSFNAIIIDNTIHQAKMVRQARKKNDKAGVDIALENFNRSLFHLSITIAQGLARVFVGYLIGCDTVYTPDNMNHPPYDDEPDSGWYFMSLAFGGCIFVVEDPTNALGAKQAGKPFLIERTRLCYGVSEAFIKNVVDDNLLACMPGGGYGRIKRLETEYKPHNCEELRELGMKDMGPSRRKLNQEVLKLRGSGRPVTEAKKPRLPLSRHELLQTNQNKDLKAISVQVNPPLLPEQIRV